MIVLVDADSLVWSSTYKVKESPEDDGWNDIEEAKGKFDEFLMKIINDLEVDYDLDKVIIFNGAKGNFRKAISSDYKANRTKREFPPILEELHQYVREQYDSISAVDEETDDAVAKYWKSTSDILGKYEVMIVSIDKDYKQLPCLLYNYGIRHECLYDITEEEALQNFYTQMIVGDSADNVNYCKGYGPKFAEKHLSNCKTKYGYVKKVYELYLKIYAEEAKQKFVECYQLLKLRTE